MSGKRSWVGQNLKAKSTAFAENPATCQRPCQSAASKLPGPLKETPSEKTDCYRTSLGYEYRGSLLPGLHIQASDAIL